MRTPVLLAACFAVAEAQVFTFAKTPVPDGRSLQSLFMFYVYSEKDAPYASRKPSVSFQNLQASPDSPSQVPREYHSLQVALLPYDRFDDLVDRERFCSTHEDVKAGQAAREGQLLLRRPRPVDVGVFNVPLAGSSTPKDFAQDINATGAYFLAFVNCANFTKASVTGSVVVKQAYGMVPANEYHTMCFYGWLTVLYGVVSIGWLAGLIIRRRYLTFLHEGVAVVLFCGLLEAVSAYGHYTYWNSTGIRVKPLMVLSVTCYTFKYNLLLRLILVAAMGEGMLIPVLGCKMSATVFLVNMICMSQQCIWKSIMSSRYCSLLDAPSLLLASIPGLLICAGTFAWVLVCFSRLMDALPRQNSATAIAFSRTQRLLAAGSCASVIVATGQIIELAINSTPWQLQWVPADGAAHSVFLPFLVGMMCVWWPSEEIRTQACRPQAVEDEGGKTFAGQADESELDPLAPAGDSKTKSAGVRPERVGAPYEEGNGDVDEEAVLL